MSFLHRAFFTLPLFTAAMLLALQPPTPNTVNNLGELAAKGKLRLNPVNANQAQLVEALASQQSLRPQDPFLARIVTAWSGARTELGPHAIIHLDGRTGGPVSVQPDGMPWFPGHGMNNHLTLSDMDKWGVPAGARGTMNEIITEAVLERMARDFIARHPGWFPVGNDQLVLHPVNGGPSPDDPVRHLLFDQQVNGVPVEKAGLTFHFGFGNLVSFGAEYLAPARLSTQPELLPVQARMIALHYAGLAGRQDLQIIRDPALKIIVADDHRGALDGGYDHQLVYEFVFRIPGVMGTWMVEIDARSGEVVAFHDTNLYNNKIMGGVLPFSNDGICPTGCEQPAYPMPYTNTGLAAPNNFTTTGGNYTAAAGAVTSTLNGQYVQAVDNCGAISKSATAPADLDFGSSAGTDCTIPPGGGGAGNTRSSRACFYHLNKMKEEIRGWLPGMAFVNAKLVANVNLNQTCNAYWDGTTVNFFRSGGGCANTGEIAAIFDHEVGHGFDDNDTNGSITNPGEAYADNTMSIHHHLSCVGRGFFGAGQCGGYGDPCTSCTGVRDVDWTKHVRQVPHTLAMITGGANYVCPAPFPPVIGCAGPCNQECHCEAYPHTESLWDAATIDLPHNPIPPGGGAACAAANPGNPVSQATAWALTSRLWWQAAGTVTNHASCVTNGTAGCGASTVFHLMKLQDDSDGNLTNGTQHAAELQCAFARHQTGCTTDNNTDQLACPAVGTPTVTYAAGQGSNQIFWTTVANATHYRILRNEEGCGAGYTQLAIVAAPGTSYTDSGLAVGRSYFYEVQAYNLNTAPNPDAYCEGAVSACATQLPVDCTGATAIPMSTITQSKSGSDLRQAWSAVGNVAKYTAYSAAVPNPGSWTTGATILPPGSSNTIVNGLTGATTFHTVTDTSGCNIESPK